MTAGIPFLHCYLVKRGASPLPPHRCWGDFWFGRCSMMAEVELNHPNTSNSGTHTTAERRRPRSDNMQRSSVRLRQDDCSGRLFQSSCSGLLPEVVQRCGSSYFQLALIMPFLHFSHPPSGHIGAFISVNQRKLSGPDTTTKMQPKSTTTGQPSR